MEVTHINYLVDSDEISIKNPEGWTKKFKASSDPGKLCRMLMHFNSVPNPVEMSPTFITYVQAFVSEDVVKAILTFNKLKFDFYES